MAEVYLHVAIALKNMLTFNADGVLIDTDLCTSEVTHSVAAPRGQQPPPEMMCIIRNGDEVILTLMNNTTER